MGTAVLNTSKVLMYCGLYKNVCDILQNTSTVTYAFKASPKALKKALNQINTMIIPQSLLREREPRGNVAIFNFISRRLGTRGRQ